MTLSLSAPKLFSPGFSQNSPASGNHFSFRFSTSSAFHLSNDCWSAAVIAGAAGVSPAMADMTASDQRIKTPTARRINRRVIPFFIFRHLGQRLQSAPGEDLL